MIDTFFPVQTIHIRCEKRTKRPPETSDHPLSTSPPLPPHLLKAGADDGDPVLDGGDRVRVALGEDGLAHARRRVDGGALLLHGAHEVPVRVQQGLQRVRLLRQHAAEPQRLLRLRQPLQEDLHVGAELLRLPGGRGKGEGGVSVTRRVGADI